MIALSNSLYVDLLFVAVSISHFVLEGGGEQIAFYFPEIIYFMQTFHSYYLKKKVI